MNEEERNNLKETVISVLKSIYDPEIPVDIWTLHLIYGIDVDEEGNVKIVMTVTAPNCPVAETLPAEVKTRVQAIMGVKKVEVELILACYPTRPRPNWAWMAIMPIIPRWILCIKSPYHHDLPRRSSHLLMISN